MGHGRGEDQMLRAATSGPLGRRWRRWRWVLIAALGLLGPGVMAAPASATGSYPGETLSLAVNGSAVVGHVTDFLATGQQTDVGDYAGGFALNVFEKDPSVDPTCSPDYWDESNNSLNDPSEVRMVIGDWEGSDPTFSVPFTAVFSKPGPVLLCAYSDWITDTAASAQLTVNVAGPASAPSPPPPASTPAAAKPVNTTRPRVTRSGHSLKCSRGIWSNAPSGFSYRWLINRHPGGHAHGRKLAVSRSLRGRRVQCSVTARNAAGASTAVSRPFAVH